MLAEGFGTMLLALFIFGLTEDCNVGKPSSDLQPLFIGLTVSSIIFFVAPLTQAGLNPARDFGPRLVAWLMGWGSAALPDAVGGWFWVYILAPILGGIVAAIIFKYILEPINKNK
jgi:glycerol uptake facilitator protein